MTQIGSARNREYWRKNMNTIALLSAVWFLVTFVFIYFARDFSAFVIFGWPVSFYMAAQGSPIIYLIIVWYYARTLNRLDDEYESLKDAE